VTIVDGANRFSIVIECLPQQLLADHINTSTASASATLKNSFNSSNGDVVADHSSCFILKTETSGYF